VRPEESARFRPGGDNRAVMPPRPRVLVMRALPLVLAVALFATPGAAAAGVCIPFGWGLVCANAEAGNAVAADVFVGTFADWRSAHLVASPSGAGAAAHGYGVLTAGALDVYVGASPAGPYADAFFCTPSVLWSPGVCDSALGHARRVAPLLP